METLSATYQSHTPKPTTSHLREPRPRPVGGLTRNMHPAESQDLQQGPLYPTASRESNVSNGSYNDALSSSSDASQRSVHTDITSPPSSQPSHQTHTQDAIYTKESNGEVRTTTPEVQVGALDALASPMSIASPAVAATNGTKRTASGLVKTVPSLPPTPSTTVQNGRRSRAESMSSTGSRAGELAANLKTRLGYAMTKVQHGWEHKTLSEVEQLAAQKAASDRYSTSYLDYGRRPPSSGLSNSTARLSMYETRNMASLDSALPPPSKRHSGSYAYAGTVSAKQPYGYSPGPRLQPAPDFRPANGAHSYHMSPSVQSATYNSAMSPPRTPSNQPRRPQAIRTDTQTAEAERDALQALFQLGSPHASQIARAQNASQANSLQASPLHADFPTPRRVTFARSESTESSADHSSSEGNVELERQRASAALEGR
jgi:hypothetical protein